MKPYAKVIVDVPSRSVDRPFDYSVPAELVAEARVGSMVAVPFGRSRRVGYVVELVDKPDVEKVSPIDAVLEIGPVFDEHVLELCRWIAEYYLVPSGEALRLAVPPGRGRRLVTSSPKAGERTVAYAALTSQAESRLGELCRAPRQAKIVQLLGEFGSMPVPTLLAEAGSSPEPLRALVARGLVAIEAHAVPRRVDGGLPSHVAHRPEHLTQAQEQALRKILAARGNACFVLDGVTGSGKTEVYIRAIEQAVAAGHGAIVLVPEISLTPQAVSRFRERLGQTVAVMHSGLSVGERHDQWMGVRSGTHRVVVGARSAIFAPVANLGMIVVDEEHETSYKQNTSPRYHARDVAIRRGRLCGCPVILGSATPSLESYHAIETGAAVHLRLPGRVAGRPMPSVQVVDMRDEFAAGNRSIFSEALAQAMESALDAGEKVVLFINRRGFSSFLLCRDCGYVPACERCAVALVYHERGRQLRCHHCDWAQTVPPACPRCGSAYLRHFGIGTQRVEDEVRAAHTGVPVVRMDADTTKSRNSHVRHLAEFAGAGSAVLLGTQMVAKGHDFPEVTVVGVVNADTALGLPDFRAAERTFQLLVQVSGRAGRGAMPGCVVIQTYWPDHYAIAAVAAGDPEGFYDQEMRMRAEMGYPPFVPLVRVGFAGTDLAAVKAAASDAAKRLESAPAGCITLLGPAPAPLERVGGKHRWHLALKLHDVVSAKHALRQVVTKLEGYRRKKVTISVDVDPVWMS